MNGQLSDFLLSRFTICFTLCKLFHFACQISFDMAIWLLQLGQFCCERFFICSAVERTNALTSRTKLERWTYSRGPVKGERGAHVPCRDFKTYLWGFWGESHIPVGILVLYSYFPKGCRKKCALDNPKWSYGIWSIHCSWHSSCRPTFVAFLWHSQTYVHTHSCHSFKFLWRTVNWKPPTTPFGIVACSFSDNLSRNSCI